MVGLDFEPITSAGPSVIRYGARPVPRPSKVWIAATVMAKKQTRPGEVTALGGGVIA